MCSDRWQSLVFVVVVVVLFFRTVTSPWWVVILLRSLPMKTGKRLARDVFNVVALFMTSLIQTAGPQMAALKVVSSPPPNVLF